MVRHTTLRESPHLRKNVLWLLDDAWPKFMWQAPAVDHRVSITRVIDAYPEHQHVYVIGDVVIAAGLTTLVDWGTGDLPDTGWDQAIVDSLHSKGTPTTLVGLAASICPAFRGKGLSKKLLCDMKGGVAKSLRHVFPVRPNQKHLYPHLSMESYLARIREDGLVQDPWLRVHERMGRIVGVCHKSMQQQAPLHAWEMWCGAVPDSGVLPELLSPLKVVGGWGYYTEPNVWVDHHKK